MRRLGAVASRVSSLPNMGGLHTSMCSVSFPLFFVTCFITCFCSLFFVTFFVTLFSTHSILECFCKFHCFCYLFRFVFVYGSATRWDRRADRLGRSIGGPPRSFGVEWSPQHKYTGKTCGCFVFVFFLFFVCFVFAFSVFVFGEGEASFGKPTG